jgi:hypothetical protein
MLGPRNIAATIAAEYLHYRLMPQCREFSHERHGDPAMLAIGRLVLVHLGSC